MRVIHTGQRSWFALHILVGTLMILSASAVLAQEATEPIVIEVELPELALTGVEFAATVRISRPPDQPAEIPYRVIDRNTGRAIPGGMGRLTFFDETGRPKPTAQMGNLRLPHAGTIPLQFEIGQWRPIERTIRVVPGWLSVAPPILAIGLAMIFRQVIVALLAGVWLGALIRFDYAPLIALLRAADTYVIDALTDHGHASIIVFSLLLGGMIGVLAKSGGALGMATLVTRFATSSKRGQLSAWLMGILIFFDDYSNTLIVGSTMRPITDRLRISREKLAFIVDATAAPVASMALISSWIGVEIGYIADQYRALGIEGDAYVIFLRTIPHLFYPILMLIFGFIVIFTRRDFGPMWRAERRARRTGKLMADEARPASDFEDPTIAPKPDAPRRWINAAVPVVVVITTILVGMYLDGRAQLLRSGGALTLQNIFAKADSFKALVWASLLGCTVAILMVVGQRILSLMEAMDAWLTGVKSLVLAVLILVLAWSLGAVCGDLHTANYIISAIGGWLNPAFLPALVFLISATVSFATGTSWGTMGILFPLVIPLAHQMAPGQETIMLGTISSVLAGSVWGDHCSPISDTTIMSSMASSCDHIDHVRTQLPYALTVGLIGVLVGDLPTGLGWWSPWVGLLLGAILLIAVIVMVGKPVEDYVPAEISKRSERGPVAVEAAD